MSKPVYMQNPLSLEVWVVGRKLARKLAAYHWVRVRRSEDKWVLA